MKNNIIVLIVFITQISCYAQMVDSTGIQIGYMEFKCLAKYQLSMFDENKPTLVEDAIIQVRLSNTLELDHSLRQDSICGAFYVKFLKSKLNNSVELLEAKISRGYSFYSPKYDVYIGGHPHKNSQYFVTGR